MDRPPHSHSLRKGRHSVPGQWYLVTFATQERQPIFLDPPAAHLACQSFYAESVSREASTLSFVVMPDHVHWLLRLDGQLSEAVRIYKARVSAGLGQKIWQPGFHDRALRREADLKPAARYLVANPIRAGLVEYIGDYPYWDAIWL
ncbi:REP-associated tyrosine transposase [Halomonas sp. 328]|uniref:REP-associated tyrosine transposase n=1 Tax=Halomonas sp. 328 TaxID=2776704 RepID=UPI0018A789EC|nr:transposase [Halomonas sp. 328]